MCSLCIVHCVQVKSGAENMIAMYGGTGTALAPANKKLLQEAQQMLSDAKIKIEIIRNQLLRLQQTSDSTLDHLEYYTKPDNWPAEVRILELRQHLLIEAAVLEGARNILDVLQRIKQPDKKALQDVRLLFFFLFSSLPSLLTALLNSNA